MAQRVQNARKRNGKRLSFVIFSYGDSVIFAKAFLDVVKFSAHLALPSNAQKAAAGLAGRDDKGVWGAATWSKSGMILVLPSRNCFA
jgi:hypothetical protein